MRQFRPRAIAFLLTLAMLLSIRASYAAETCEGLFATESMEVADSVKENGFITNRDLSEYIHQLHKDFVNSLRNLRSDQHWIDLGAGKAIAQTQYLKSFDHRQDAPLLTAVAFKLDRIFRWARPIFYSKKLQVREGAFETQDTSTWKKADLITDVMGVISYTKDLTTTLQKVFDLLNVNGELYLEFTPWATSIKEDGTTHKLLGFLARIEGISVTGHYGIVKIVKLKENIQVPHLKLVTYKETLPPHRTFQEVDSPK